MKRLYKYCAHMLAAVLEHTDEAMLLLIPNMQDTFRTMHIGNIFFYAGYFGSSLTPSHSPIFDSINCSIVEISVALC